MTQLEMDNSTDNTKFKDGVNKNARLMVRNISFKATEDALKEHFSKYGTVEEVKLLKKPDGRLVGCGFVHFTHVPMANKAIAATNKKPFLDRPINVTWALPKNKYVDQLNEGKKGSENAASEDIKIKKEKPETKEDRKKLKVNRNARLIVRNVSFKASEESLMEHFKPYGDILEVKLLKKPDGKLVGCAFVHFKNVPMAKKALLNTNMKQFLGRPISVDWAVAKDKYMQHVVNRQLEMQEDVKKEDSDSDDDDSPMNISNEALKDEIKSESESESEEEKDSDDDGKSESDDESEAKKSEDSESDDDEDNEEDDEEEEENEPEDDEKSQSDVQEKKRIRLNDAEDGCTVFVTNVPFSAGDAALRRAGERAGAVRYALVCVDKLTEHSKGSGFIKFENKEDADKFLSLPASELRLEGQVLQVKPALKRENLQKDKKKVAKDNRNLYLVKEGVVVAGTAAAAGVSASDMAKRLALERSKTQMLKNLNRFVSRYRLVVSNLPARADDAALRRLCAGAGRTSITEARVMRDLRATPATSGLHPSKGYGFVMFTKHEDALACLRRINNNPDIFDKNNRPIVSFSIEDRTVLNARKKRLEKSIANNPLANKSDDSGKKGRWNRKRKNNAPPEEGYAKKVKFNKQNNNKNSEAGKFVRNPSDNQPGEYTGLTAKEGTPHKMRSFQKLKAQANLHRETVKKEKKFGKHAQRLKRAAKERIKQPKQKVNKDKSQKSRRNKNKRFNNK